jgi:thiopeptide-type bacteriocin biosynthesis protein
MQNHEWLQYNVYSKDIHELDYLVDFIVKPATAKVISNFSVNNWFFIRYLDETGPHIRLRFKVNEHQYAEVITFLEEFISISFQSLEKQSINTPKRLLPLNTETGQFSSSERRFELSLYDPELDKYGESAGIELCEEYFCLSSNLVVEIMEEIIAEKINRFEFALRLMDSILKISIDNQNDRNEFLLNYTKYWAGDNNGSSEKKISQNFIESAAARKEKVQEILSAEYSPEIEGLIRHFSNELAVIIHNLKTFGETEPKEIFFHFVHMMNNRLGVWPIEESYLAALLISVSDLKVVN